MYTLPIIAIVVDFDITEGEDLIMWGHHGDIFCKYCIQL